MFVYSELLLKRVNILGEALDGLGRWYVAVPPFLIVGFLAALFFLTGAGQAKTAGGQRAPAEIGDARARHGSAADPPSPDRSPSQRGFLLTGEQKYLDRYESIVGECRRPAGAIGASLRGFRIRPCRCPQFARRDREAACGSCDHSRHSKIPGHAGGDRPGENQRRLRTPARPSTIPLEQMRSRESVEHREASAQWSHSLVLSRWITAAATIFNMLLVGVAARLVYMDMRRRMLQTAELRDQKLQLEREAEQRNRELIELSTHLQSVAEREKAGLARELHDELGGLLVGARMDISWAEQHLGGEHPDVNLRLQRVQQSLSAGVDLKRRIIEELRPTLLDNVGLFAALRWQLKETCGTAGIKCVESYPDEEPRFTSEAAIALFRIAQEAFTNILKHSEAKSVDVTLIIDDGCPRHEDFG